MFVEFFIVNGDAYVPEHVFWTQWRPTCDLADDTGGSCTTVEVQMGKKSSGVHCSIAGSNIAEIDMKHCLPAAQGCLTIHNASSAWLSNASWPRQLCQCLHTLPEWVDLSKPSWTISEYCFCKDYLQWWNANLCEVVLTIEVYEDSMAQWMAAGSLLASVGFTMAWLVPEGFESFHF